MEKSTRYMITTLFVGIAIIVIIGLGAGFITDDSEPSQSFEPTPTGSMF